MFDLIIVSKLYKLIGESNTNFFSVYAEKSINKKELKKGK